MILFAAIFSRTLYCYVSINIDMEDCSQPLYFSMHAKEKESEASMKQVGVWAWACRQASSSFTVLPALQ